MSQTAQSSQAPSDLKAIDVRIADNVAYLTLNRPDDFNSMNEDFWRELPVVVSDIEENASARAIVLASTGKHFTSGMDLSVFTGGVANEGGKQDQREFGRQRANLRRSILRIQETFNVLERSRVPVLAAIQGGCIGGGVDMISACDMRYCTEDAFFCIQEINIGITADVGTLQRLPHLMPDGLVREIAYTGRRLAAHEARECGLVNAVYPTQDAMLESVGAIAREIAARSPLAVWGTKEMLNYTRDHTVAEGLDYIATWQAGMFHPSDMIEAFKAKQEKRAADFEDLIPMPKSGLGL